MLVMYMDDHYKWKRISIAFNPQEEKFEVANNAILKSGKWIPDIAPILVPTHDTFNFVMEYCKVNEISDQMSQINSVINKLRGGIEQQPWCHFIGSGSGYRQRNGDLYPH